MVSGDLADYGALEKQIGDLFAPFVSQLFSTGAALDRSAGELFARIDLFLADPIGNRCYRDEAFNYLCGVLGDDGAGERSGMPELFRRSWICNPAMLDEPQRSSCCRRLFSLLAVFYDRLPAQCLRSVLYGSPFEAELLQAAQMRPAGASSSFIVPLLFERIVSSYSAMIGRMELYLCGSNDPAEPVPDASEAAVLDQQLSAPERLLERLVTLSASFGKYRVPADTPLFENICIRMVAFIMSRTSDSLQIRSYLNRMYRWIGSIVPAAVPREFASDANATLKKGSGFVLIRVDNGRMKVRRTGCGDFGFMLPQLQFICYEFFRRSVPVLQRFAGFGEKLALVRRMCGEGVRTAEAVQDWSRIGRDTAGSPAELLTLKNYFFLLPVEIFLRLGGISDSAYDQQLHFWLLSLAPAAPAKIFLSGRRVSELGRTDSSLYGFMMRQNIFPLASSASGDLLFILTGENVLAVFHGRSGFRIFCFTPGMLSSVLQSSCGITVHEDGAAQIYGLIAAMEKIDGGGFIEAAERLAPRAAVILPDFNERGSSGRSRRRLLSSSLPGGGAVGADHTVYYWGPSDVRFTDLYAGYFNFGRGTVSTGSAHADECLLQIRRIRAVYQVSQSPEDHFVNRYTVTLLRRGLLAPQFDCTVAAVMHAVDRPLACSQVRMISADGKLIISFCSEDLITAFSLFIVTALPAVSFAVEAVCFPFAPDDSSRS